VSKQVRKKVEMGRDKVRERVVRSLMKSKCGIQVEDEDELGRVARAKIWLLNTVFSKSITKEV
jgi:hypothetical protein